MTAQQLTEFAWGLAKSKKNFLWIIRVDIVSSDTVILPLEFVAKTKDRGLLASWCPQEQVLNHPAIGGFLTHSGWCLTIEFVSGGVLMICWPFFGEQQTNCWCSHGEWGIGLEIDSDVKQEEVKKLVRELMEGEKGKEMKKKAMEWKKAAEEGAGAGGLSSLNFDKLVSELLK
ncbi:7-deoxyloganetin glucosyltransferase [Camellia lanceoleosa]|uniref:7-deoxyloganetin glucosyltransferase n=1 Tax=Camellia lanceoleosa TaxID=1840588 RepID=A0ACC0IP08_9ERIC|nr:7-deoxyloganetin glucosyltransferase [Camellia lanceoleosa]